MTLLRNSPVWVLLAVLVATAVSQSVLRVNPAEAEDTHIKYSLHNRQQCQRLCWYTGVCLRYSYRTKTQTGADYPHNCVIHVSKGQGEQLEEGWMEERASGDSLYPGGERTGGWGIDGVLGECVPVVADGPWEGGTALICPSDNHGCKVRPCGTDTLCIPSAYNAIPHVCARIPDVNECSSSPCQDQANAYTCTCAAGFTGDNCQTNLNECTPSPCQNGGTCQDEVSGFTCNCVAGYTGNSCGTNIDECTPNPCQNGGTCQDEVSDLTCNCVAGYTGNSCETHIDECSSSPCQNGGKCLDQVNTYTCKCVTGYTGDRCQTNIEECSSNPCQNGGTCEDEVNGFTCNCVAGYTGTICAKNIDECSSSPCDNGGKCLDQVNAYTCNCAAGYTGHRCQTNINECSSNPCQNGGICEDEVNGFTCNCVEGFNGNICETISAWLESQCSNGSQCPVAQSECFRGKCLCTPGYYYSTGNRTCLADCPLADTDEGFIQYEKGALLATSLWFGYVTGMSECQKRCLRNVTNCRSFNYQAAALQCFLKTDTALTAAPSSYRRDYTGFDHYQRTCA